MTPAGKIRASQYRALFAQEAARPDRELRLEYGALLIAAEDQPNSELDIRAYLRRLAELAEQAREHIAAAPLEAIVEAFNRFMFEEQGFAGNRLDYYDARNSFLNEVIERRTGIPITLSIVYMEVGRRAGLEVEGVGMPGHFVVRARAAGSRETALVDPFDGRIISPEDCQERLDQMYDGRVLLTSEHLGAVTSREILFRMLTNLKALYAGRKLYARALAAQERMLLLLPRAAVEQRDLAALLAECGRVREAIAATEKYLQLVPGAADAAEIRERLFQLQRKQALLN
ncbi:MAG TPA: transglutaminase-like domain-containing protein [Pyrinomonadaceae bacterium]